METGMAARAECVCRRGEGCALSRKTVLAALCFTIVPAFGACVSTGAGTGTDDGSKVVGGSLVDAPGCFDVSLRFDVGLGLPEAGAVDATAEGAARGSCGRMTAGAERLLAVEAHFQRNRGADPAEGPAVRRTSGYDPGDLRLPRSLD
jgi:hypothetical protein